MLPRSSSPLRIRAELFGVERLEQHAAALAARQRVDRRPRRGTPLRTLVENDARRVLATYMALVDLVRRDLAIPPSAEWLIDNNHIVQEQVREIREALPGSFYRQLPKLETGRFAGYPRVYELAWEFVAHTDSRVDADTLTAYVRAWQGASPLTMGELWAIPIMLRVVLLENARGIGQRIVRSRQARTRADDLADSLLPRPDDEGPAMPMEQWPKESLEPALAVELAQRLRGIDPVATPVLEWLEKRLAEQGIGLDEIVRREQAEQLADHATIANVIGSMRQISAFDWRLWFEGVSEVEAVLRGDATGIYPRMDFATRDVFRHAIEQLARGSGAEEPDVARLVVERAARARAGDAGDAEDPAGFIGWHLIRGGRRTLEQDLGYRLPRSRWLRRGVVGAGVWGYLGTIALITTPLLALMLAYTERLGAGWPTLVTLGLLALIPATDLAIAVLHRDLGELLQPRRLPKLEFAHGVGPSHRTLVAVPTLLTGEGGIDELLERLERHYLANSEGEVGFALVSDWRDAPGEEAPDDERLLAHAARGVRDLNETYGPGPWGGPRFLLLHRRRVWCDSERSWVGWERKRGKIHELNRFLRGADDTTFLTRGDGLTDVPPDVRFVITLDSDTRLPAGAAARLAGALAHPLNRPRFDPDVGRVTSGYGILQPRVTPLMPGTEGTSLYHMLFSGPTGIDPYAAAVSDVYQDLFSEGSFVGKGIYDVDAFEAALGGRVPEGALLSHDLFEGALARCGLVSDIEVFDDFPTHYEVNARRIHRWARGDWQLLPWILGRGPRPGTSLPVRLTAISRWKMIDNLRRTLSPGSTFLLLVAGWILVPGSPLAWTGFVVATLLFPAAFPIVTGLLPRRRGIAKRSHARALLNDAVDAGARVALAVVFLPNRAAIMTDAIGRTLWRLYVSRRHLLQWVPAAMEGRTVPLQVVGFYRRMWKPVALAGVAGLTLFMVRPETLPSVAPLLLLWLASPTVAHWISRPRVDDPLAELSAADIHQLRRWGRRTWAYFDRFVDAEHHWLPSDNFQLDPHPVLAQRTSPTNIGMYLLAAVAARDLGWIGTVELAERVDRTLESMEGLERLHGHLFNWYDTTTRRPLEPRYVSTVDSGNLAGHLLTVAQACREFAVRAPESPEAAAGIGDAVALARLADRAAEGHPAGPVPRRDFQATLDRIEQALAPGDDAPERSWSDTLELLAEEAVALADIADVLAQESPGGAEPRVWAEAVRRAVESHARDLREEPDGLARRLADIAMRADAVARGMDFSFLYDPERKLFTLGYRLGENRLDRSYYDMLASEARLASLVAIAKGDVDVEHWFHLGRSLTPVGRGSALLSWSGSMFEYLMPHLVMEAPPGTMMERSQRLVVERQIQYGRERGVPWGISESAYHARDLEFTYQYSHFGVPGLGLTRGLSEDLVVAPYATALAAMIDPPAAIRNLERIESERGLDTLGFYEALDYTPSRVPTDRTVAVVKAHMAHHQGMTVVAFANVLTRGRMRRRFHAVPIIAANELLLQEKIPRGAAVARPRSEEVAAVRRVREIVPPVARRFTSPFHARPRAHILSNGRYSVMLTHAGGGYSHYQDLAVTRWREDPTRDPWGAFVFLRDAESGHVWSAGYQPARVAPDQYEVTFLEDRAEFHRFDESISTTMEVVVSPEDDGELRRITVRNDGARTREIEVTSYAEVVLATPGADRAHPAFSNLFVQTEYAAAFGAILATRRPREQEQRPVWAVHVLALEGTAVGTLQHETDRARFLDRGRELRDAICVAEGRPLSNTTGPVLDPVFGLRRTIRLRSGEMARLTFSTLVAPDRDAALALADKYHDPMIFEREASLAWNQAQVQLQHLGVTPDEAFQFQRLASRLLFLDPALRSTHGAPGVDKQGQKALWPLGISGDLPLVLARIDDIADRDMVRQLLRAHEYWGSKGLAVDLVVLNEHPVTYSEDLQAWLERMMRITRSSSHDSHEPHGAVHLLRSDHVAPADVELLRSAARVELMGWRGSLTEQLEGALREDEARPVAVPRPAPRSPAAPVSPPPRPRLSYFNGFGGFAEQGREYVVILGEGQWTPAPWINVVANPEFGFQVSEAGSGFTWAGNSRENRLTPWSNDPIGDPAGEALYVRDEETGAVWTPTPLPIRESSVYTIRHGQGWSRFEHESHEVALDLLQFVPPDDPVKISRLTLRNRSASARRLSVTAYAEWVLGVSREATAPHVTTWIDEESGALFAHNPWTEEFAGRVAFADLGGRQTSWTADRTEFVGRNGSLQQPSGMAPKVVLSGRTGGGLDPCATLRGEILVPAGGEVVVDFLLGQGRDAAHARDLVDRYRAEDLDALFEVVQTFWNDVLGALQVRVPDSSIGILLNRWLLYQALACRVWARSAFYQSGGAYGFRDQLQDVMALTVARREVAREHLLRSAERQFVEGDVQHWWHPPSGRGVRTRITDDRLWLPFAVHHYVNVTGDDAVLDEPAAFLTGPALEPGEDEAYFEPAVADETGSLFEHCARAIDVSLSLGAHGLPLIGTGDWNDGMNRIGRLGKGESVWLGWFLHLVLEGFLPIARARGEESRAARWEAVRERIGKALEEEGWDGDWYRRAYFDDGTPVGSADNVECRIDSIAQSWGVMSGAAAPERAEHAMQAVDQYLVHRGDGLVLLFTPPFDRTELDPGYIKGYLPGVRENGGQYTHAAIWSVIAFAELGRGDEAVELFNVLNPINHASTRAGIHRYKVEPYVSVADVYAEPPHVGRGGWTWYTGSAGWMYRAGMEWILGFRMRGSTLWLDPCIPRNWPGYEISFRYHSARYDVAVENPHGVMFSVAEVELDGEPLESEPPPDRRYYDRRAARIPLADDGRDHSIRVVLG